MPDGNVIINIKTVATGLSQIDQTKAKIQQLDDVARKGGVSVFGLNEKLLALKSAVFTERDAGKIKLFNAAIKETQAEMKALQTAGTSSFGAIGSGATKAYSALRTISYILPGIGIAGLIGFATGPIIDYVSSLTQGSEAIKKLVKDNAEFADSLDKVRAEGEATGLQLQGLVNIAKDQTQSLKTRNEALKEANKILGEHGDKLTLVNIATAAVTEEINKFTEATIQQALANKFADRAADLIIKQREAIKSYTKARLDQAAAQKIVNETNASTDEMGGSSIISDLNALSKATKNRSSAAKEYVLITQQLKDVTNDLSLAQKLSVQLFGELGTKSKDGSDKAKKSIETIDSVLKQLDKDLQGLKFDHVLFNHSTAQKQIDLIHAAVIKLVKDLNVGTDTLLPHDPSQTILGKLFGDIYNLTPIVTEQVRTLIKSIEEVIKEHGPIVAPIHPQIDLPPLSAEAENQFFLTGQDLQAALDKGLNDGLESIFENSLITLGETLGAALTGSADIGDFFDGLFKQIGTGLKQLGAYFIKTAIEIKIFKEFATKYPLLAIAAGVALVALGSVIQNATSKKKAFASGGLVGGVGNRDTIDALLTPGEFVMTRSAVQRIGVDNLAALNRGSLPNANIGNNVSTGVQTLVLQGELIARGKDLVLVGARASASLSRTG